MTKRKRRRAASAVQPRSPAQSPASDRWSPDARRAFAGLARPLALVVALAVAAYANAIRNGFTLDDIPIVAESPVVRSIGNIGTIFGTSYWSRGGSETLGDPTLYRPLTVSTYAIDFAVWGARPAAFHAMNVVLHAAATALLLIVAAGVLGSVMAAFVAAAIFAVHPIHVEAVTSVVGRAEILATLFVLAAFLVMRSHRAGTDGTSGPSPTRWVGRATLGAALFLLGLFSKESAVTLPAILALDDWLGRDPGPASARPDRAAIAVRYAALAVAAAIYVALRQHAVSGPAHIWPGWAGVPAGERILTASRVLMEYVALFVFPRTLQADYWKTDVPIASSLGDPLVVLSVALWIGLAVVVARTRRREPALAFSIAWFFVTIAPVSNLMFPIGVAKAERLLYLPSAGLCLAAGWAYARLDARIRAGWAPRLALAAAIVALAARTAVRNQDWRDNLTLAMATLTVSPSSPLMNDIAAEQLVKLGDSNRALALLQEAVRQAPDMPLVRTHLGLVYYGQGRLTEAIAEYRESIRRNPTEAEAHNNLGVAYARTGQYDLAANAYREALRLKPGYAAAQQNLNAVNAARAAQASAKP